MRGRDYGVVLLPSAEYFQIQLISPGGAADFPVTIQSLLILPPVGDVPADLTEGLSLALWQEFQQVLPGAVRLLSPRGRFAAYTTTANLLSEDGSPVSSELERIGRLTGASHVLLPRIIDYRPYHPQKITIEWVIFDADRGRTALTLVGCIDASEQRVVMAADAYLRERKAKPYLSSNLDVMLRSPREFNGFAIAQALKSLRGKVKSGTLPAIKFKQLDELDDNPFGSENFK